MKKVVVHSDGASRGNPGAAAIGVVVKDALGRAISELGEYIGVATNNVAEYTGLIRGLQEARRLGADTVQINTDSELLARQITGHYGVKSPNLRPLFDTVMHLISQFREVSVSHVPRRLNSRADELANQALDRHLNNSGS